MTSASVYIHFDGFDRNFSVIYEVSSHQIITSKKLQNISNLPKIIKCRVRVHSIMSVTFFRFIVLLNIRLTL